MPTWSMPGGSCAPIENSPPGIHTMPVGGTPEDRVALGIVAAKRLGEAGDPATDGGTGVVFTAAGFSHTALRTAMASPAPPKPRPAHQIRDARWRRTAAGRDGRCFNAMT